MPSETIIIGAGPAGLFAAGELLKKGAHGIVILEMGRDIDKRKCPSTVQCNCVNCDILEGVGGAGGFSDGKSTFSLTRGTQTETLFHPEDEDILEEIRKIIRFYSGMPGYDSKGIDKVPSYITEAGFTMEGYPLNHLGSDGIQKFIRAYRDHLVNSGVVIRTHTTALNVENGDISRYRVRYRKEDEPGYSTYQVNNVIIATGLQGTPWVEAQAEALGIKLAEGPAGFGIRLETDADVLDELFNIFYDFKMTYGYPHFSTVHGAQETVYRSFCCNKRGFVVNENHRTLGIRNVNGHSYLNGPGSPFSNFAIIAKLTSPNAQNLVRDTARKINSAMNGGTAVQRVRDFNKGEPSAHSNVKRRTNHQALSGIDIGAYMPDFLRRGFSSVIHRFGKILSKFDPYAALIYAPEIKYYGLKMPVDFSTWEVYNHPGLYVVGNASGYLDGFVSAALTGIKAADHITGPH